MEYVNHANIWSNPSKISASDAAQMAAFLEERSAMKDMQEVNRRFCRVVHARVGERLLEVGSGSGVLCRMLASQVLPGGCVTGIDISPIMTIEADKYTRQAGITEGISFKTASAEALPFHDNSFDCAFAARLLLHVEQVDQALREMMRVIKPAGRVVVMDWDFETVTVDHPDRDLTRRILHWRTDHHGGDNWSGRALWRIMRTAGLQDLSFHPCVSMAYGEQDGLTQSLWRAAEVACQGGAITEAEHRVWISELKNRIQAGTFLATVVYFIVKGIVPAF